MRTLLTIMVLPLLFVTCTTPAVDKSNEVQIAVLRGPSAMSMVGLMDKGFRFGNRQAVFQVFNEPAQVQALMVRGETDIALLPGNMAAILYNRGVDYRLVSVPVWGTLFLAGEDSSVQDWNDLRGKKVYLMARGATPDLIFRYLLQLNGLVPDKDIQLDYTFPNHLELFTAITAGRASLGILAEPFLSQAMLENPKVHLCLDLEKEWNIALADSVPMMQTALVVRDSFCFQETAWLDAFHRAYAREVEWIRSNPDSAGILCMRFGLIRDPIAGRDAIKRSGIRVKLASDERAGIYRYLHTLWSFNADAVGGRMPDDSFIFQIPHP
ncbi:MAG: PhnD/SsuA/transferrin family substrate-binding protein [Bacteroidales bacterium]